MSYNDIETAMVDYLTFKLPNYEIQGYPNSPETYQFIDPHAAILIKYTNSQYANQSSRTQRLLINYEIHILSRNLHGNDGYDLMELVRDTITSLTIEGSKFYVINEEQYDYADGVWYFRIRVALPFMRLNNGK